MNALLDPSPALAAHGPSRHRRTCFPLRVLSPPTIADLPAPRLEQEPAEALARLLGLLVCGEEAATIAFDGLAHAHTGDPVAADALHRIADEERVHEGLLNALADRLPPVRDEAGRLVAARRFHVQLGQGDQTTHLARIAALDSAVCTLLARLLWPTSPLGKDPVVSDVLRHIGRDEARHVRISRGLALARRDARALRATAVSARDSLVDLLTLAADDFETLECDPGRLFRDLARLPDGLFGL